MTVPIRVTLINVDINKIFPNVWNPNEQSTFVYEKERNSIRTHGFIDPILVREIAEGYEIIDGEHRWRAAKEEMMTEVPCNNLGAVTDSVAKQLTIIMNETRGEARRDKLSDLLADLAQSVALPELQKNLPFEPIEIDALIKQTTIDWSKVGLGVEGGAPMSSDESGEEWEDFKLRLPVSVAAQFRLQIERFKRLLHPNEESLEKVSHVQAVEAMIQHVAQTPDAGVI